MTEQREEMHYSPGLADVIAAETRLSRVEGEEGRLTIVGHDVEELAEAFTFEDVAGMLLLADPECGDPACTWADGLGEARAEAFDRLPDCVAEQTDPMDAVRAALGCTPSSGELREDAMRAVATVPVAVGNWWAEQTDREPLAPDPSLEHADDYLRIVTGEPQGEAAVEGLNRYLVTVSDHGLNASTFTARVIASTRSDLVSSATGAVGALKGPLHGGAPGPVLDMFDEIGEPERAEAWLRNELEEGRRIMGMGHRVYRARDPRAAVFEEAVAKLSASDRPTGRIELAHAVEEAAEDVLAEKYPERNLRANVEFYTAVLLEAVGLPRELFPATFAVGRVAGWAGHVREQREADTLIRPRAK
ncbi:MAG: citrate synthase, partial [Bradymonadaceae bacterium]